MTIYVNGKKINDIVIQGKSVAFGYNNGRLFFQKNTEVFGIHTIKFIPKTSNPNFYLTLKAGGQEYHITAKNSSAEITKPIGTKVHWEITGLTTWFTCSQMSGEFTITDTPGTTTINITQVKAMVGVNPTPSDATVTIDGERTKFKTIAIPGTFRYAVSKEGYIGQSGTVEATGDTVVNVALVKEEYVTINFSYSPAIAANIISNNPAVTVTRTGGNTSGATLTALKGTTARIQVTPTVSGYRSTYADVTFDSNKSISVTLTSTVMYRCYIATISGRTVYVYAASDAVPGSYIYISNTNVYNGKFIPYAEVAMNPASNSLQLVVAQGMFLPSGARSKNLIVSSIDESTLVSRPEDLSLHNLEQSWTRHSANDLTS